MVVTIETMTEPDAYVHAYVKAKWFRASTVSRALMSIVNMNVQAAITNAEAPLANAAITHNFEPLTATSLFVISDSSVDTGSTVHLFVLNSAGAIATKDVVLTDDTPGVGGTPTQAEVTLNLGFLGAYMDAAPTGNVIIGNTGQTEVYGYIAAAALHSEHAYFMCPAGKQAVVVFWRPFTNDAPLVAGTGETVVFNVYKNGVLVQTSTITSIVGTAPVDFFPLVVLDAYDVLEVECDCSEATGTASVQFVLAVI